MCSLSSRLPDRFESVWMTDQEKFIICQINQQFTSALGAQNRLLDKNHTIVTCFSLETHGIPCI